VAGLALWCLITWSSDTLCVPSPRIESRAAVDRLDRPHRVRSMQGICTRPANGIAGQSQVVLHADLRCVFDLFVGAIECRDQPLRRHRARHADLALGSPISAPEIDALRL